jgi:hypothetical protein
MTNAVTRSQSYEYQLLSSDFKRYQLDLAQVGGSAHDLALATTVGSSGRSLSVRKPERPGRVRRQGLNFPLTRNGF